MRIALNVSKFNDTFDLNNKDYYDYFAMVSLSIDGKDKAYRNELWVKLIVLTDMWLLRDWLHQIYYMFIITNISKWNFIFYLFSAHFFLTQVNINENMK